ncbi:MAG: hypothetical protein IPP77_00185 [Bacteroidetes bacterium]|nr:hypothetical protein [Bacteroidota bacterium]
MNTSKFFTLRKDYVDVALMCMVMTEAMQTQKDTQKTALLTGDSQAAFKHLLQTLIGMIDKNGQAKHRDLVLDRTMSFALMHGIVQSFYRMKGHLLLPKEERKPISDEQEAEIENMYDEMKDPAADLLWELTEALNYLDYGLQTLDEVFDRKPAVRPLKVDNKEIIFEVTLKEADLRLFSWVYGNLEVLKNYKEDYDFAQRFCSCRFMHLSDYEAVKKKLNQKIEGEIIQLTLRDVIVLYYTLSLGSKLFVSDADAIFDELIKDSDRNDPQGDLRIVRNHFLKLSDGILSTLKKEFKHNKTFMLEIDRVKNW